MVFKKIKWQLFIGFVLSLEIIDIILFFLFHSESVLFHIIFIIFNASMITLLLFMFILIRRTTKELSKSNQRLNSIFDSLDVAIWSHDLKSNILLITPGIEKLYGYSLDEFYRDHLLWKKVVYREDLPIIEARQVLLNENKPVTSIYRIVRPDGNVRWIRDRGIPRYDEKGNFVDFTSVLFDVTDQKEREERYRGLIEMSPDIIAVVRDWKFVFINEAGSKLFGVESAYQLVGKSVLDYVSSDNLRKIQEIVNDMEEKALEKNHFECEVIQPDGNLIDAEISIMSILYEGRQAKLVIGRDITERKKANQLIHEMAFYDALTGLPNRNMFKEHLNNRLFNKDGDQMLAILFLDLDRFKIINDTKGHSTGDLLLQQVASRLKNAVKEKGLVSRQGGDEFLILLDAKNNEEIEIVALQVIEEFSRPFYLSGEEFFVTPSIGISLYPVDGEDQETLIKNADNAMYLAKERGKNNFQYYNPDLNKHSRRKMELEVGLRKALARNQFVIHYQPQYEIDTQKIVAVEALLRWNHPQLGFVSPAEFIPLAEETGLIVPIGKWILREVCEQHNRWKEAGFGSIRVAVNISVRQMQERNFIQDVKRVMNDFQIDPTDLELEITESIMQNIENSILILNELKELGVKIAIDDFGKGYSSLSYLKHLPIDQIKIDKSFVDDILDPSHNGSIAKAIIDMGHNMNFTVIAEGIEEEEQVNFLLNNECTLGQGYYFSKPLPVEEVSKLLM